ncbi:hypothetical protein NM688_g7749 [Phlebia brevispora]|uniref:Uncharacterized protein n=1 Tax=Phlebia brevispora TaxID=194682 RepID=A0ACC1S1Q7_9APHY|nr:hypothetical protein NM688_g7749 [Phlebia brevispora]
MYPKLVALGIETIFTGRLDGKEWGKGPNASPKVEDNMRLVDKWTIEDKSNPAIKIYLSEDISRIVKDILEHGAKLAIVSRNTSKALCDRALYHFKAENKTGEDERITELADYYEVVNEPITAHFRRIHSWTDIDYADMILFDGDKANNIVQRDLRIRAGITFHGCAQGAGLTWEDYTDGIEKWRRQNRSRAADDPSLLDAAEVKPSKARESARA